MSCLILLTAVFIHQEVHLAEHLFEVPGVA